MELAIQLASNDKTVREETIQDLKNFESQSSMTQAKTGERLLAFLPAIEKRFITLGDEVMELKTEIFILKNIRRDNHQKYEKGLEKARLKKQPKKTGDGKEAKICLWE